MRVSAGVSGNKSLPDPIPYPLFLETIKGSRYSTSRVFTQFPGNPGEGLEMRLALINLQKVSLSLVPRLSWNTNMYRAKSLVSFVRKHDISKIGPNRKATFCSFFNQLCFNARCVCYSTPDS